MKNKEDVFKKAVIWYSKGGDYRKAALELYDEDKLKKELQNVEKEQHNIVVKNREKELKKKLDRCTKLFPIGTLIDSDDGSDKCLNIVVGKPYIGEEDYHWPNYCNVPTWELGNHKTVLIKTVRVSFNKVIGKSIVCLENLLQFMDNPSKDFLPKRGIVNLKNYVSQKNEMKRKEIDRINKEIDKVEMEVSLLKSEFSLYDSYKPEEFTQEKINEIVKKYKNF